MSTLTSVCVITGLPVWSSLCTLRFPFTLPSVNGWWSPSAQWDDLPQATNAYPCSARLRALTSPPLQRWSVDCGCPDVHLRLVALQRFGTVQRSQWTLFRLTNGHPWGNCYHSLDEPLTLRNRYSRKLRWSISVQAASNPAPRHEDHMAW
jgi:hypothetical protein